MALEEAFSIARQKGLDLIEVQPRANPPVVKIADLAKFLYQQKKAQRKKGAQKGGKVKEIRFALNIFEHDLAIKARRARKFLEKQYKVKVQLKLRRFERELKEKAKEKIKVFLSLVETPIAFDQKPQKNPLGYVFIMRKAHAPEKTTDES